ncbi:hypothetical protein [Corynebacterium glyciniphilum]|uniref:hypothetical protein n=1 Tax=Corynebacterium glyciniphilum TaxID=1404244 RepID=UPI003FD2DDE2
MSPEEAQALEPGTTPGPWEAYTVPGDRTTADYVAVSLGDREMVVPPRNGGMGTALDAHLIAAGPDMRATIAAMEWQYGVEVRPDEDSEWLRIGPWWPTVEKARAYRGHAILRLGTPYSHDRVIRRLVGPVEVVEE